jgi:hypothetical protein
MALPKWRPFTWVVLAINVLLLIWIVAGVTSSGNECAGLTGPELQLCQTGATVGTGIGVGIIVTLWAFVDVILGVIWLITNPKRRTCPACGNDVKKGLTACPKCGYDFAAAARGTWTPPPPPPTP